MRANRSWFLVELEYALFRLTVENSTLVRSDDAEEEVELFLYVLREVGDVEGHTSGGK